MPVTDFSTLQTQLGVLTWPLLLCAFLALMICLERSALFLHQTLLSIWPKKQAWIKALRQSSSAATTENVSMLLAQTSAQQDLLARGATLLLKQVHQPKVLREELLSLWLNKQQRDLQAGLKVLQVIGIISPLLGLLGTVLGLIDMFAQLGQSQGPVTPSQLSAGLGLAMNTTAAGLIIAVPAITAAHLFGIWAQGQCLRAGHVLNQLNLWLAGIEDISIGNNQYQAFSKVSSKSRSSSTEQKSAFNAHTQIESQT